MSKRSGLTFLPKVQFETNPYKTINKPPSEISVIPRESCETEYFPTFSVQETHLTPESYHCVLVQNDPLPTTTELQWY